jgi:tetratricopeptide (TPR) repeat protein
MRYRLFIAYAQADEAWVKGYLVPALGLDEGVRPMWEIRPGAVITEDIERAMAQSQYTLVVMSKAWEADEWARFAKVLAERLFVKSRGIRAIPCILEDCSVELVGDALKTIDCRDYAQPRSEGIETQAEKGLAALRTMLELAAAAPARESIECPYPGMVAFESTKFFFGRDEEIQRLVEHVRDHALTVAVGPSGSGKSSLIRAGLMPRMSATWPIREVRLLDRPCAHLGQALGVDVTEDAPLPDLGPAIHTLLAGQPPDARVLVVVDPLEELFQLAPADKAQALREQERFCELLRALAREPRCACVLAQRADFYADLMNSPLWPLVEHNLFPIAPLDGNGLRRAIHEPAARQGVWMERDLVERLMADARGEPGALPLLQETLRSLWEKRERLGFRRLLPRSLYEAIREKEGDNPLAAILARKAEAALAKLPAREERDLVQPLLLRLVHFGEDGRYTRRQQRMTDLEDIGNAESVRRVVDHLARQRLLALTGAAPTEKTDGSVAGARVDLAHEAILNAWPTLARWIEDWREHEQKRRRLEDKAREWVDHERLGGLLDAVALAEAEAWLRSENAQRLGISADLRGLVAASRAVLARSRRRRVLAESALAVLAVVTGISALVAVQQRAEAERQRDHALQVIHESRDLARSIVHTADRKLAPIAGTAEARKTLLHAAGRLLERLRSADASDLEATRDMAVRHNERGDLAMSHDDLEQAREHYQKALELIRALVATDPENASWQSDLWVSYNNLGNIEAVAGNLDTARSLLRDGLDMAKKLAASDPNNSEWQRQLAVSYNQLGDIEWPAGNLDAARSLFRDGLDITEKLVASDPSNAAWQRDLEVSYIKLGEVETGAGNLDSARSLFRNGLDIAKRLAAVDPNNAQWQRDLSVLYNKLGDIETVAGNLDAARSLLRDGLALREHLAAMDLNNAEWQRDLSVSYERLGNVETAAGNLDSARALFRDGLDIAKNLADKDPNNAGWQRDLSVSYETLANLEAAAGNLDAARALFRDGLDIAKKLADKDPNNAGWQRDLIASEMRLAQLEADAQKLAEAGHHLEAANAVLARLDAAGLLHGDALLEQYRQVVLDFEHKLPQ